MGLLWRQSVHGENRGYTGATLRAPRGVARLLDNLRGASALFCHPVSGRHLLVDLDTFLTRSGLMA